MRTFWFTCILLGAPALAFSSPCDWNVMVWDTGYWYSSSCAATPPAAPVVNPAANPGTTTQPGATLAWGAVSGASSYRVQVANNASFTGPVVDTTVQGTSIGLGSALTGYGKWYWRVCAVNAYGTQGAWTSSSLTLLLSKANVKSIVFNAKQSSTGAWEMWIMDADGSNQRKILNNATDVIGRLSPNGKKVAYLQNASSASGVRPDLFVMDIDGANVKQLTNRGELSDLGEKGVNAFSWYPDSQNLIYEVGYSSTEQKIYRIAATGTGESLVFNNANDKDVNPVVNPRNNKLVYFIYDSGNWTPNREIRVYNAANASQTTLFQSNNLSDFDLNVSKDGKTLVWSEETTSLQGDFHLRVMNTDGSGARTITVPGVTKMTYPSFTSDGLRILFVADDEDIWSVNVDGSSPVQFTSNLWTAMPIWASMSSPALSHTLLLLK